MKSRDALEILYRESDECPHKCDNCKHLENNGICKLYQCYKMIARDLEILEILRKHLYVAPELVELKMTGQEYANIHNVKYHNGIPIVVDAETFININKWFDEVDRRN